MTDDASRVGVRVDLNDRRKPVALGTGVKLRAVMIELVRILRCVVRGFLDRIVVWLLRVPGRMILDLGSWITVCAPRGTLKR